MREVAQGIYQVEGLRASAVYALAVDGGVALIDTCMPGSEAMIEAQLRAAGYSLSDLRAIMLTHAHFDHTGSAAALAARSGAEVLAHRGDVPYIEGAAPLPYPSWFQRASMGLAEGLLGDAIHCQVTRTLEDGEVLEELGGLEVLHVAGHTPGSICLYQPEQQALFSGDLLVHSQRFSAYAAVRFSIPQFSVDPEEARRSARRLLELPIEVLCCGHGEPVVGGVRDRLHELLDSVHDGS